MMTIVVVKFNLFAYTSHKQTVFLIKTSHYNSMACFGLIKRNYDIIIKKRGLTSMRKIFSTFLIFSFLVVSFMLCGFSFFKEKTQIVEKKQLQSFSINQNNTWCITFQLVWNDFIDTLNKGKPVEFVGGNPPIADELNKKLYSKDLLSENSY